jgi:hypothetical protein
VGEGGKSKQKVLLAPPERCELCEQPEEGWGEGMAESFPAFFPSTK